MLGWQKKSFSELLKLDSSGISTFTMEEIKAKAAILDLTDSLTLQAVAKAKDADFTAKAISGTLTYGKALIDNIDDIDKIADALEKSGKIPKQQMQVLSTLEKGSDKYNQYIKSIINGTDEIADSIINLSSVGTKSMSWVDGISNTFTGLAASLKPLLPLMATAATLFAAYEGFKFLDDKYTLTFKTAQDHLAESSSAYANTMSELGELNSKTEEYKSTLESIGSKYDISFSGTETIEEMITKIRSLDGNKLEITDEATINKLERENTLLDTQQKILTTTATTQQKKAAEDARKSINFSSEDIFLRNANGDIANVGRDGTAIKHKVDRDRYIRDQVLEMERAQKKINEAQEKINDESISKKDKKKYEEQFNQATKDLEKYRSLATDKLAEINEEAENFYDKQTGLVLKGFEDDVRKINALNDLVTGFDLSPTEKTLSQIESFFDGSKTSNNLKEQLLEAVKAGESATDALHAMGITLNDLGITGEGKKVAFDNYFEGLIDSAKEAEQVIKSIDGSVDGVKAAFESENKDADWNSMSEYLKQAEEIYTKTGKIGTDDFKAAVQFITPEVINPDGADFKYDADAYVAAWEKARDKVKRYFDSENPLDSVNNFTNDIINSGLASKAGDDITWGFKTSAEAAKALGLSVEATEVAMRNLEAYGAEFDDVMWSGEGLERYEKALNGIKTLYDSMDDGKAKNNLGKLIEGWDNELAGYQADLSTLTEDQIVKIEFEYDIASIKAEIEQLQNEIDSSGGGTKEWGSLNSKKKTYQDKLLSQDGMSEAAKDTGYQKSLEKINTLSQQLKSDYKKLGEDGRREIQLQQSALYDLQNVYLETYSKDNSINWDKFLGSKEFDSAIEQISEKTGLTKSKLNQLLKDDLKIDVDADTSKAESKIDGIASNNGKTIVMEVEASTEQIQAQINNLQIGQKLVFSAEVDGSLSGIEAVKNKNGTITYSADINGVTQEVKPVLNQDGTVDYTLGESPDEVPNAKGEADYSLGEHPKTAPNISGQANYKGSFPTSAPTLYGKVVYSGDYSGVKGGGVVNAAVNAGKKASKASKAEGTLLPSYAFGTGYNVLNYKNAYTNGKISLSQDEEALVNELGTESIIRDGKWLLLPGGMHIQALKKGDIVLTAEQTADLLNHGKTNGNARAYANGTLGNAYANGFRLPNAVINNSSSTKKKKKSSSSTSSTTTPSTNTADSISDTNEKAEEFEETLDAIEILINRIERQIKNLERVAGSAFNTFEKRNNALREQMSSITQEISAQQQGYERYLQKANSVELSEDYKNLVRNGAIDISTITDEELSKNIQEFQEWYEKALDCRDAIEELKESVRELYTEAFENVVTLYDGMLNQIDHRRNMLEGYIDQTEAQGYIVSTKYYDALISNEQNKLNKLTKERNDLINAMNDAIVNGGIEMYSEQWYEFQEDINSVNEAIQDANTSIIKFKNSIREIKWDIFDKVQDRISAITDEADFLVKVMSDEDMYDDKGVVTKHGTATYGLHGVNYNVFMSQADQYKKEMKAIEKELSKDPYNQTLIERRKELLELQQESILAAEDEKQAIKNLVEEGIQKQLDALKELIDKYNEALDSQKDMYDYQKDIDKKQKTVDSLEKQWLAYQGDDSEEGSVNRQQTWNDLEEARAELEETQYEKYISDQKKLLDELYTEYETVLNMRLDNLDQLIASVIEGVNAEGSNIRDTLISESEKVGYTLTNSMETIWGSNGPIANILTTYSGNFSSIMTSVQAAINDIKIAIQNAVSASNKNASENISKINKDQTQQTTKPTTVQKPATKPTTTKPATNNTGGDGVPRVGDRVTYTKDRYYYSSDGLNPSGNQMLGQSVYITSINNASWAKKPYHIFRGSTLGNGDLGWVSLDQLKGYRTGTPLIDKNQLAWTQEVGGELVLGRSDGAILTPLKRGDAVVNKEGTDQVVEFAKNPKAFIGKSLSELTQEMPITRNEGIGTTVQNDIHMSIGIDHVEGYNDFVTQLQKDHQFERFIQTITTDRMMGKGNLGKYNVRFR